MQYLYADITVSPYSEATCDVLTAMLGEIGFDSFEMTDTGIKAYIPKELFDEEALRHIDLEGLYPCGEGAGYAGGIVSAAIDGERCAEAAARGLGYQAG